MTEIRTVLFPVSGSGDELVRQVAVDIARATGATIHLVRACDIGGVSMWPSAVVVSGSRRHCDEVMQEAREATDRLLGRRCVIHAEEGRPADVIVQVAKRIAADLIVTSGRVRHGTAAVFLGSISEEILERSPSPVLIVHGDDIQWPPSEVSAFFDGSPQAELALTYARDLAGVLKVPLNAVRVLPGPSRNVASFQTLGARILVGNVTEQLGKFLSVHPHTVIAMGTSGHGAIPLTHIGSVATHLLRTTNAVFIIVPPGAVESGESSIPGAGRIGTGL